MKTARRYLPRILDWFHRQAARRCSRLDLRDLTDRELQDLGFRRSDFDGQAYPMPAEAPAISRAAARRRRGPDCPSSTGAPCRHRMPSA
ncbi:DUF1127 domain-containing protein [Mesorhizobium sp. NPDC059054]|uniref:DUF1127 domain-containing protein n=1 Tax=Mesorhizobium sp. NPDC059054 TaxID=3346711 RepID=UPI0036778D53